MDFLGINRSEKIGRVQQTYPGGFWLRISRDNLKKNVSCEEIGSQCCRWKTITDGQIRYALRNTLESKMESMIINRTKTIRKVQQTYTGSSRLRFSRDMQKKVRTVPMY
ncbi:hypothetical protein T12_13093 [Trichinella patagoniensis]|uniref:Uncharacterized protein n=1 Tax=Trichinella patagoniensis TaxID=990121 RepID=A0A0V0Z4N3_9BILA|nr:hypothetical protein T12_13093 [Trichinella patagoniensis]